MARTASRLAICISLLCIFGPNALAQDVSQAIRITNLLGSDAALRSAAKAELLNHPDPALLPALLKALPTSTGSNRHDMMEILAKYDDARKIPVFVALIKTEKWNSGSLQVREQLAKLGAPAARAVLDGCAGEGTEYASEAAIVLSWMQKPGQPFLIQAVETEDSCQHEVGVAGLRDEFGEADPRSELRADIELAAGAVIDPDERIRNAARTWFDSWKGKEDQIDFTRIVDALIAVYQAKSPPETMVKIAQMLSDTERPRVTRFMRAAVHAPNPEIQKIAKEYLGSFSPPPESPPAQGKHPKTRGAEI